MLSIFNKMFLEWYEKLVLMFLLAATQWCNQILILMLSHKITAFGCKEKLGPFFFTPSKF